MAEYANQMEADRMTPEIGQKLLYIWLEDEETQNMTNHVMK